MLLMDRVGRYHSQQFLAECSVREIKVIFLIRDASDRTQPLDLLAFCPITKQFSASKFDHLANSQPNEVVRMLQVSFAATLPITMWRRS
jgi:hypothetical protein